MNKYIHILILLFVVFGSLPAYAQVWTEFATMKVRGMDVTLYGDKTSLRIDEQEEDKRRVWVKFEMSGSMKSQYNDKEYRTRKEEYFFDCEEKIFAVAHTVLLDKNNNEVYDSGYHHPLDPGYQKNWYDVTPGSGPEIIYDKVCNIQIDDNEERTVSPDKQALKENGKDFITAGYITGGEITDGLDVKNIRWATWKGFERLVLDVYKWGGYEKPEGVEPAEKPGYFEVSMPKGENRLDIKLGGYRSFSADMPDIRDSAIIQSIAINRDEKLADDSGYLVNIALKKPSSFKAFELHSPGRIVVDLKADQ